MNNVTLSYEQLELFIDFSKLLITHKYTFLSHGVSLLKKISNSLPAIDHAIPLKKVIDYTIKHIHSSFKRYQILKNFCLKILSLHNKKIFFLTTSMQLSYKALLEIEDFMQKKYEGFVFLDYVVRPELIYGFQLYTDKTRIEFTYQRLIQDMYSATNYIGYTA